MNTFRDRDFFVKAEYVDDTRSKAMLFRVASRDSNFSPYYFWFPKSMISEIEGKGYILFIPPNFSLGKDNIKSGELVDKYEVEKANEIEYGDKGKGYCKKHDRKYFGEKCPECSFKMIELKVEEDNSFECPYCKRKTLKSLFTPNGVCQECDDMAYRSDQSGGFY